MPALITRRLIAGLSALWLLVAMVATPAAAAQTGAAVDAPPQPPLYRVTLPAAGREARTELATAGIALDAVGSDTVTTIVDAAGLAELRRAGRRPLNVAPLDFPPADAAFHTYDEMLAAIAETAAAHPDIIRVITAGLSLEGRAIPAVKISDEPDRDDATEPDVLFLSLHHAREHLTVEMALEVLRLFTEGYGRDPALTNLVNTREIWVLPNVNPDGGEYDVASDYYHYWRKNRRPNADGSTGVDLNRNYGYRWGGDGSSGWPGDETYRGPAAFSEPETQVVRDFVLSHPGITAAITFHTYAELILYPYGYTYDNLPPDMDPDDLRTFRKLAADMAGTNGYTPQQASDLYATSGDTVDWLYGARRIFAFTFEMYPTDFYPGFYPPGSAIERETRRNDAAVAYLTAVADNPRKVVGLGGDTTPPTVTVTVAPPAPWPVTVPVTLAASAADDVGVTLVAWQVDGTTAAMDTTAPFTATWTRTTSGPHVFQALAFDAGGNVGASAPVTLTAVVAAEAHLALPDPPVVPLTAPLVLTFTRPIVAETVVLRFAPPMNYSDYWVVSDDGLTAQVHHAPFRPATHYTLFLEGGYGPDSVLLPNRWTFWSDQWRGYMPRIDSLR